MCLQFSMNMPTLVGYILIQTESQSVQGVNSYDILFAGMSNVWKGTFLQIRSHMLYALYYIIASVDSIYYAQIICLLYWHNA